MLAEIPLEEFHAALDDVAMQILADAGMDRPPVDALALAETLNLQIAWDDRQRGRARLVRLQGARGRPSRPTILLRPEPRLERRHWAVAHEIGEQFAHRVFAALSVDPRIAPPSAREEVANHLAGRLLLPWAWFAADAPACDWDLAWLKATYATASHELIARRMLELPAGVIISIFDQGQLYFRRSNVPGSVPPPSSAETECWQAVHAEGAPHETYAGPQRIQGWPVHEDAWKREILRTEVEPALVG